MTRTIGLLLALGGCGPWMTEGEMHWIHRAGADLPVLVRGNLDSGTFIVTVHGGPGGSGLAMGLSPGLRRLEEDAAVVYWDQRFSGMSQGNPSEDTITVDDYVADTDSVLAMVQQAHEVERLYVYGHSWGGDLTLATMVSASHAGDVDAWVVDGGAHDEQMAVDESRAWMIDTIEGYLEDGIDTEFWSNALDWYDAHPVLVPSNGEHYSYVSLTKGYFYDPSVYEEPPVGELAFASPYAMGIYQNNDRSQRLAEGLLDGFDVSGGLPVVTAPVLVMGGEHDGAVPTPVAEEIFELLGTDPADKQLTILPGVAHSPRDECPELFAETVSEFIGRYP